VQWGLCLHCMNLQVGLLRGHERAIVTFSFSPVKQMVYNARAALLLLPPDAVQASAAVSCCEEAAAGPGKQQQGTEGVVLEQGAEPPGDSQQAEILDTATAGEKLIMTIVGEATQGALTIDPPVVGFGVVHVGCPLHKTLSLINQSDGVLRYSVEVADESATGTDQSAAACLFGVSAAAALEGHGCMGGNSSGLNGPCWVDEPDGIISARCAC